MQFNKENLNPQEIVKDLQEAVSTLSDFDGWQDYFEGGAGRTIIELIAGSQAIKNHYNLMRVRESSIQHAKLDSSITELAINKGVYRPAAKGYIIELSFTSNTSGQVQEGQMLGAYKDMEVYSLENKLIYLGENTLKVTIGKMVTKTFTVQTDDDYFQIDFEYEHEYIGDHFQRLSVNDNVAKIVDTPINLYNQDLDKSVISLVFGNRGRLIFGDGVIGKKVTYNDIITYRTLNFDKKTIENFDSKKVQFDNAAIFGQVTFTLERKATPYLDKEKLRRVAIRNSIDGRWVETGDYEAGLIREFGEYLNDVKALDNYPDEDLIILPKVGMATDTLKDQIATLIENKRGNAVKVVTQYIDPEDSANYVDIEINLDYFGVDSMETINEVLAGFKDELENKIFTQETWLVAVDLAVDITKKLPSGKMYAALDENFQILQYQFIRSLTLNYTIR